MEYFFVCVGKKYTEFLPVVLNNEKDDMNRTVHEVDVCIGEDAVNFFENLFDCPITPITSNLSNRFANSFSAFKGIYFGLQRRTWCPDSYR